jgi:hypothetical protein
VLADGTCDKNRMGLPNITIDSSNTTIESIVSSSLIACKTSPAQAEMNMYRIRSERQAGLTRFRSRSSTVSFERPLLAKDTELSLSPWYTV